MVLRLIITALFGGPGGISELLNRCFELRSQREGNYLQKEKLLSPQLKKEEEGYSHNPLAFFANLKLHENPVLQDQGFRLVPW